MSITTSTIDVRGYESARACTYYITSSRSHATDPGNYFRIFNRVHFYMYISWNLSFEESAFHALRCMYTNPHI
ncbi:8017_t:CDS:2 [Diversispora eburnea]|uniref:8017_t:CDS:1 n=1 Tax=Diversispora eburnea TaxID=1213867 RepID=A0A9N9BAM1_9GLOM|nr:8017_t:CDS:2 [Diversispora eburnea]